MLITPLEIWLYLRRAAPLRLGVNLQRLCVYFSLSLGVNAAAFQFPTANHGLLDPQQHEQFFVGTTGKPWSTGRFGCVRTDGRQFHEGLDIRCLQRDARGEPADSVHATAEGLVVYRNAQAGLSNYGRYLILRHRLEGIEVYSLYAHLSKIPAGLVPGVTVRPGQPIAVMGRTANTAKPISRARAHVHFELNLLVNDRFETWSQLQDADRRNDHGPWNGQNLLGLNAEEILLLQARQGPAFSLLRYLREQPEMFRVMVRDLAFPWLNRYAPLIRRNPVAEREGIRGFEISFNFNGVPFLLIPRAESELRTAGRIELLSVNESEYNQHSCRRLVTRRGQRWQLSETGRNLVELLLF